MFPGMLHAKFHNSRCISLSPFPRNDQNTALLWPKYGPHMVLEIGSSWILIILPRDVPCQILHCLVYPLAPLPSNGQNITHNNFFKNPFDENRKVYSIVCDTPRCSKNMRNHTLDYGMIIQLEGENIDI